MTSTRVSDGPRQRVRRADVGWLTVGRVSTFAAIVFCLLLQWINHDWFPPEVSVSQYGLGPRGWVFTTWAALLALSVLALTRGGPDLGARRTRTVYGWLVVGSAGLLLMGIVRTDAGGAQQSWHARTHMVGSILALLALPVGILLAIGWARVRWRRAAAICAVVSAAALLLVLASAFGASTLGMDAQHSWAFWQSVAVAADMLLVAVFALAGLSGRAAGPVDGAIPAQR